MKEKTLIGMKYKRKRNKMEMAVYINVSIKTKLALKNEKCLSRLR